MSLSEEELSRIESEAKTLVRNFKTWGIRPSRDCSDVLALVAEVRRLQSIAGPFGHAPCFGGGSCMLCGKALDENRQPL